MNWTEEEKQFLDKNYPLYGGKYCSIKLNRSVDTIGTYARSRNLSAKNAIKHSELQNVDINKFLNISTTEIAYFLGFMWSDGYIRHYKAKNGIENYKVSLEINKDDAESILSILKEICDFSIHKRKREKTWKETYTFSKNNKNLYQFLEENDYVNKSNEEPTKILSKIPQHLKNYFWKGIIDGDGSTGLIGRGAYFEVASTYNYNYTELDLWLKSIGTYGKVYRQISKKGHKSSAYKVYGKKILYIYDILPYYGLIRKNEKLKQIQKRYEK